MFSLDVLHVLFHVVEDNFEMIVCQEDLKGLAFRIDWSLRPSQSDSSYLILVVFNAFLHEVKSEPMKTLRENRVPVPYPLEEVVAYSLQ